MNKHRQNNSKKTTFYFSCGVLILSVLFLIIYCKPDRLNYNSGQVRSFSQKTLTTLYQTFSKPTSESKKYQTTKDKNYQRQISANALKHNDFHTLIAICQKKPTKINKAYVFACG